jgi:glycolate oxidase FAD binding subunit
MIVAQPDTIDGVSTLVREAGAQGKRVSVIGGGTHTQCCRPPGSIDIELHTGRLDSVASYTPDDMTISVQAGMTASRLSALLMEHGCRLPLDVEEPERATIGGIAASGWSGPRRLGLGSLRDLLIGARVVLGDGTVVKTGGMVVKNVSGYDLTKLLHGSFGSLGVIVELNFKALPVPARELALTYQLPGGAEAVKAATALFASRLPFVAIEAASDGTMIAGCEGHPADVERLRLASGDAAARLGGREAIRALGHADAARAWRARTRAPFDAATVTFRIASLPSRMADAVATVERVAEGLGHRPVWRADAGCGSIDVSVESSASVEPLAALENALIERFGAVRALRCPEQMRSSLKIFGRPPQGLSLMRALKAQFDPNGVLNVGTNVGGI